MNACAPFRAELEQALAGSAGALARLASHEHARACAACRAELVRERALDGLLERLPPPSVPAALARKLLARLAEERTSARPAARSGRIEDGELEDLLGELPAPRVPDGLAARVLEGLAPAREARRARSLPRAWLFGAAAALLVALTLWRASALRGPDRRIELAQGSGAELEADEELLTYAFERWELLQDEDLDLWLAGLDPVDELLIEYAADEAWLDEGAQGAQPEGN